MSGFKAFLLRGNLIELAVAFIIGAGFATVVTAFTEFVLALIAKAGGSPNVGHIYILGDALNGVDFAPFLNALIAFIVLAAVVYFGIVVPYTKAKEKFFPTPPEEPAGTPEDIVLLTEIRDALTKNA